MKKTISALFFCVIVFCLAACGKTETPAATAPDAQNGPRAETAEPYTGPSLDEMSPPKLSTALPIEIEKTYADVDKSGFRPIALKDSRMPDSKATAVYRSGSSEYYVMEKGVVTALLEADDGTYYSAYYDGDGRLQYLGDETRSWFFTETGEFDYMTYSYGPEVGRQVVSFYEGEDTRFAVYAAQTYYDGALNELTEQEKIKLVVRVSAAFSMMGGVNALG